MILTTPRLRLRPYQMADFEPFAAFWASDRSRHMGGPLPRWRAWKQFCADIGQWSLRGYGVWAVDREGTLQGWVGFHHPEDYPEGAELGWWLTAPAEGQGIAAEAARAARAHAFGALGWTRLLSYIAPENTRSRALADRLGAVPDAAIGGPSGRDLVYRHWPPGPRP